MEEAQGAKTLQPEQRETIPAMEQLMERMREYFPDMAFDTKRPTTPPLQHATWRSNSPKDNYTRQKSQIGIPSSRRIWKINWVLSPVYLQLLWQMLLHHQRCLSNPGSPRWRQGTQSRGWEIRDRQREWSDLGSLQTFPICQSWTESMKRKESEGWTWPQGWHSQVRRERHRQDERLPTQQNQWSPWELSKLLSSNAVLTLLLAIHAKSMTSA